jgi:hypothetical protein
MAAPDPGCRPTILNQENMLCHLDIAASEGLFFDALDVAVTF